LLPAVSLLQGCDLAVTGVITYDAAVSSQEHAAYTEYLFATQAENKPLQQAGKPPLPVIPEKKWRADIYRIRLAYADYYTRQISTNGAVHSFEVWKEIDCPIEQAKQHAPIKRRGE
jgi:hypothetical protein